LENTAHVLYDKLPYFTLIAIFFLIEYLQRQHIYSPYFEVPKSNYKRIWNFALYSLFIWTIIIFGKYGSKEFIYFQF
jgi:quinol-cytochrome oxidoreductase complex cytochrome b subunit